MIEIIGVDPGGTTGWGRFFDGKMVEVGETNFDNIFEWIKDQVPTLWVVENYRIRPPNFNGNFYDHSWDTGEALQIIGAIKLQALTKNEAPVILQEPHEKVMGYKMLGKEYKKGKKGMHIFDALAHVHVYLAKEANKAIRGR